MTVLIPKERGVMFEVYSFLCLTVLPICCFGGPNGVREYLSILFAGSFWCGILSGWYALPPIPDAVISFGLLIILSIFWSEHKDNSLYEAVTILSSLTLLVAVQGLPLEMVILFIFLPAPGIAATAILEELRNPPTVRTEGVFGNCNHLGVYLALTIMAGGWLTVEISLGFLPFVLLVLGGIIVSRSRNAWVSTVVGVGVLAVFAGYWWVLPVALGFAVFAVWYLWDGIARRSADARITLIRKAVNLIIAKPIFGWGLNTYKIQNGYQLPACASHRVHNDIVEFTYELGVIGFVVLMGIYVNLNWSLSPFLSAQVVIGILTAMFFFPFREIHTVMPIMGILGILTLQTAGIPWQYILILSLIYIIWQQVGRRAIGLYWYAMGSRKKTKREQYDYCSKASQYNPNSEYLSRTAYLAAANGELDVMWNVLCRTLYQFDGVVLLCSLYVQIAQAALMRGAYNLAVFYNNIGLKLSPTFAGCLALKAELDRIQINLEQRRKSHAV